MKKIILCISTLSENTLKTCKKELENLNLDVCAVTSQEISEDAVKKNFPEVDWCGWRTATNLYHWNERFDPNYFEKVIGNQRAEALPLADRYEPSGGGYLESEVRTMVDFSFAQNIIDKHHPEMVIFAREIPEPSIEYCLYKIAKQRGIEVLIIRQLAIEMRRFLATSDIKTPLLPNRLRSAKGIERNSNYYFSLLSPKTQKLISDLRSNSKNYEPIYMKGLSYKYYRSATGDMVKEIASRIFKKKSLRGGLGYLFKTQSGPIFVWRLRKRYEKLTAQKPNFRSKGFSVYFPLHYQPELTSMPGGGVFANQIRAIKVLSDGLPSNAKIFVKEHPAQFSMNLKSKSAYRQKNFYQYLLAIPGVELVPMEVHSSELQETVDATAVVTGSAGLESIIRGKPVFVFGFPYYLNAPGAYSVDNERDVAAAVSEIRASGPLRIKEVFEFLLALENISFAEDELITWKSLDYSEDNNAIYMAALLSILQTPSRVSVQGL